MTKTTIKSQIRYTFLMFMMLMLWCGNISAAIVGEGTTENPYVLENGTSYTVEAFKSFYAKFTAPSAGKFVLTNIDSYQVFTDGTYTTVDETIIPQFNNDYQNKEYSFDCKAGKTYYVGLDFAWDKYVTTFKFLTGAEPVELRSCNPAEGSVLSVSDASVDLKFNQNVMVRSCTISSGSNSADLPVAIHDIYASVNAQSVLLDWYDNKTINEGDEITLTFSGITSADGTMTYGEDGTYTVKYKAEAKPVLLVSSVNTPLDSPNLPFKSYYMKDDNSSLVTLQFSDEIGSIGEVSLEYGSREPVGGNEEFYREILTPTNIGAGYILVDLKGKRRRAEDMIPGATNKYEYITLTFNEVRGKSGNLATSTAQGSVGKFVFNYKFEEVAYSVMSDIDEGNPIAADTKNIKLWISEDGGNAVFSGAEFAYKENGADKTATVEGSSLTVVADPDDENARIITIPVPNVTIDANTTVTMTLNAETPDGMTHPEFSKEINCTGKTADNTDFAVVSAIWHDGENDVNMVNGNIAELKWESTTTVVLNKKFGYCEWTIDEDGGENIRAGYKSFDTPDASFDIDWFGEKFFQGKTYTFTLKAWNKEEESHDASIDNPTVGTASFTFNGASEAYVYSDVELTNVITGSVPLFNKEQNTYILEFSAPANVKKAVINLGGGMSADCPAVARNDEKTEWTVTLDADVLSSSNAFDLNVFAEDMEGHAINKASSESVEVTELEANTWLTIRFSCDFNLPDFTVEPASESTVEKIDVITFSYKGGINISYSGDKIQIWGDRELVKEIEMSELKRPEGYDGVDKLCVVLDEPITKAGYYTVNVPAGFFFLGEQFESYNSKTTIIYYEVNAQTGTELTVTPKSESVVESLDKIVFTYEPGINANWNCTDKITVLNKMTREVVAEFTGDDVEYDWDDITSVWVEFAEPITAAGIYDVTVPAGFFLLGESGNDVNEAMVIHYEVKAQTAPQEGFDITVDPAGGNVTEIPATIVLTATDRFMIGNSDEILPTLKNDKGEEYALTTEYGEGMNQVNIVLTDGAITADGTYTLTIPAGSLIGDDETDLNKEIVIVYVIGTVDGIDNIVANAGGKVDVYTVNGTNVLRNADAAAVKALAKGLYIVNGKKVVIK